MGEPESGGRCFKCSQHNMSSWCMNRRTCPKCFPTCQLRVVGCLKILFSSFAPEKTNSFLLPFLRRVWRYELGLQVRRGHCRTCWFWLKGRHWARLFDVFWCGKQPCSSLSECSCHDCFKKEVKQDWPCRQRLPNSTDQKIRNMLSSRKLVQESSVAN